MPNYLRYHMGTMYFFTLVAHERRDIFCQEDFLSAFKNAIKEVRQTHPFQVIAWVQLPDHLHCILQFEEDTDFGKIWGMIKRLTTKACPQYHLPIEQLSYSKVSRNEKGLWQRRFYEHMIRNEQDLIQHLHYIHYNPVKHGLVANVKDWQFSTFHRYVLDGFYDIDWGRDTTINIDDME